MIALRCTLHPILVEQAATAGLVGSVYRATTPRANNHDVDERDRSDLHVYRVDITDRYTDSARPLTERALILEKLTTSEIGA